MRVPCQAPGAPALITIDDLVVRFGDLVAVDGVSLEIPAGSLFGLLGPNGAGKTTAIACIAGLTRPTRGEVRIAGSTTSAKVSRGLGVAPQALALHPTLSVVDNLRVFGGIHGLRGSRLRERVDWALELAQLTDRRRTRVHTLSGGMKRRLNLAASLLHDPRIVICDEPTTGVDPQSRNHLFETIRALHAEGRTVLYTTHYMEEVEALCDRVAIMDRGAILVEDTLERLLEPEGGASELHVTLAEECEPDRLADRMREGGLRVERVTARRRSLEQVFLDLTGRELRDGS